MARGNFGRNGGRNGGRRGGRNGGRNAKDKIIQATSADEIFDNIGSTSQDEAVGNSITSTQDVLVENDEILNVNEAAAETSANHNSEESQTLNGGIHNEAENGARQSIYEHINAKRTVNGRQVIRVFAKELYPSCARSIREVFEHKVDISGYCWADVTMETKNFYFEEFRKRYYWDEAIEELVKIAWDKKANTRYNVMVCKDNQVNVPQDIWDEWQKYFYSKEFLRKSRKIQTIKREERTVGFRKTDQSRATEAANLNKTESLLGMTRTPNVVPPLSRAQTRSRPSTSWLLQERIKRNPPQKSK